MFIALSIRAPIPDVTELDRICKSKDLSRSQYIRAALEYYNENPTQPIVTRKNNLFKGQPKRPLILMLASIHIEIINKFQAIYKATKVQIIRQAIINKSLLDGETFNTFTPLTLPTIDQKWEGKWVKAADVYDLLGIHRNKFYRTTSGIEYVEGLKTCRYPEKWYRLTDIIRLFSIGDAQAELLAVKGLKEEGIDSD